MACEFLNYKTYICGASSRKPYNLGEKIFIFLADLNSPDSKIYKIYNLPYFIVRKIQKLSDRKLESCMAQFSFPSVFLAFWAFMISDFIRVT